MQRSFFGRHYALAVVAIIFVALLAAAGLRSTPGVLMVPWGQAFGWSRQTVSFAAAVGIFLFGLTGPFAAAAMQRFGIRATVITALTMMSLSTAASLFMKEPWQLVLTWGVVSGIGSGCITNVLSATIVNRWFVTNRGLVMGLFAASTSTGTLIFIPVLSAISLDHGWKPVVFCVALFMALLVPLVFVALPEEPADIGAVPFGADADHPTLPRDRSNGLRVRETSSRPRRAFRWSPSARKNRPCMKPPPETKRPGIERPGTRQPGSSRPGVKPLGLTTTRIRTARPPQFRRRAAGRSTRPRSNHVTRFDEP